MNISIDQLFKLADQFCEKIKPGTLHGDSKTIISFELGMFVRFVKKERESSRRFYMVAVSDKSKDQPDQRVDGYLGFNTKEKKLTCLYTRGDAIKKARIFNGKIEKFTGTPNKKKHYFV